MTLNNLSFSIPSLQLYPSVLTSRYPFSNYNILNSETRPEESEFISMQLVEGQSEFFYHEQTQNNRGFFSEVVLSFDENNLVTSNLDFSFFLFASQTNMDTLSETQREEAKLLNRRPHLEPSKLASYLQDGDGPLVLRVIVLRFISPTFQ